MKQFKLKAALAEGLSDRLYRMHPDKVTDIIKIDVVDAIRACQRIVRKINEANVVFHSEVKRIEDLKKDKYEQMEALFKAESFGKEGEEIKTMAKNRTIELQKEFNEIQATSKAEPDVEVGIELGDDDYTKILIPLTKGTAGDWEMGTGEGQKLFLECMDAIEAVTNV